jgi:hypothetical protein
MGTAYAEHPLSTSQRDALLKKGFSRVLDIRFAPDVLLEGDKKIFKKKKEKKALAETLKQSEQNRTTINQADKID